MKVHCLKFQHRYFYHPNHNFVAPFNIIGDISKIAACVDNNNGTYNDNVTFNAANCLVFYTFNKNLYQGMNVFIDIQDSKTGLKLNSNPYEIKVIEEFHNELEYDRATAYDSVYQKFIISKGPTECQAS